MTDFDARLRERLIRLDAAIPEAPAPVTTLPARRVNRRRQAVFVLAAAAVFLGATALAAVANQPPPDPAVVARNTADEERLRNDLGTFTGDACLSAAEVKDLVHARLQALGLSGWTIREDGRTSQALCVTVAPAGDTHEVLLLPSMGGPVDHALEALGAELLATCVSRDDAVARVRDTIAANGIADPRVEVTGIRGVPVEGGDAYVAHVKAGCYVYGGAQFDDVGRYTWFVSGP